MMRQFTITYLRKQRTGTIAWTLGIDLPVIAIILACGLNFLLKTPIPVNRPGVLLLGAVFILLPFRSEPPNILQKVAAFYLISIPVNELASQYYTLALPSIDVDVSCSSVILLLCTIGYLVAGRKSSRSAPNAEIPSPLNSWILALVVIIVHMVLLGLALEVFYGYGYEHNLNVLGNLALYFLLFIVLRRPLGLLYFRRRAALILTFFYLVVTVTGLGRH